MLYQQSKGKGPNSCCSGMVRMKAQTSKQTGVEFDDNCADVDIFAYEQTMCIDVAYDNNCDYFRVTGRAVK